MYQYGWKRNISYIIAFSRDDIQDVTWKYYNDHRKLLKNRTRCSEKELLKTILLLREKRQKVASKYRKRFLKIRTLNEVIQMMLPRQPTENEKKGRSSGSLSWKLSRGETQDSSNNVSSILGWLNELNLSVRFLSFQFYAFSLLPQEISGKQFTLRYSSKLDQYERLIDGNVVETAKGWQSCAFRWKDVFRKEERDWKVTYIARAEDSECGEIEWNFDFRSSNLSIREISLKLEKKTFENGSINIQFLHNGKFIGRNLIIIFNIHPFKFLQEKFFRILKM